MIRHMLYGLGNDHPELGRVLWGVAVVAGIAYSGWHLGRDGVFNIIEFGTGMGLLLAGGGGAIAMKDTAVSKAKTAAGEQ